MVFLWFMAVWTWLFVSLMLAVMMVAAGYRLVRAELGLHFWPEEVAVAMGGSLVQAAAFAVLWFWHSLGWMWLPIHLAVAFVAAVVCYKAAHRTTMKYPGALVIAAVDQAVALPLGMLLASL
ncbi:MAG TPA: hypothetical protein VNA25_00110 [Phycisphaerae bacterium]|nr:hypothetical protein [Phycisphaerae bacterium]